LIYRPRASPRCTDDPGDGCGAMQLNGDDDANPGQGAQALLRFQLDEEPWDNPTQLFRVQMIEREVRSESNTAWELFWRSEVWTQSSVIGEKDWVSEWFIEYCLGIKIPELSDSKILFGLSQTAAPNWEGGIDADLVGSAYWTFP
jgi:hypothetical protein